MKKIGAAVLILFSSCQSDQDKKDIKWWHECRKRENAIYHNYDTSYAAAEKSFYKNKNKRGEGGRKSADAPAPFAHMPIIVIPASHGK